MHFHSPAAFTLSEGVPLRFELLDAVGEQKAFPLPILTLHFDLLQLKVQCLAVGFPFLFSLLFSVCLLCTFQLSLTDLLSFLHAELFHFIFSLNFAVSLNVPSTIILLQPLQVTFSGKVFFLEDTLLVVHLVDVRFRFGAALF